MKTSSNSILRIIALLICTALLAACESDSDGGISKDVGDNDPNIVVAMGDSITKGGFSGNLPWPSRLSMMIGKSVINMGVAGATSGDGVNQINRALSQNPGYVILAYGANDAINGINSAKVEGNIAAMIAAIKENQSIPIVANVMPMTEERELYNGNVVAINESIRAAASAQGAKMVNLYNAVGTDPGQYYVDGLHLNDAGENLVAMRFADVF